MLKTRRTQYANELARGDQDWLFEHRIEKRLAKKKQAARRKKQEQIPDFLDRWDETPKRSRKRSKRMVDSAEQEEKVAVFDPPKKRRRKK